MIRTLAATLLLAGCTAASGLPDHPLVGHWEGEKPLTLKNAEYQFGSESGYWSAGRNDLRYKTASGAQERCDYALSGRTLTLTGCRMAGRYTRTP